MNTLFLTKALPFLLQLAADAPHLLQQGAQLYADIAHGEGGVTKVQKALADLGALIGGVAPASSSSSAST